MDLTWHSCAVIHMNSCLMNVKESLREIFKRLHPCTLPITVWCGNACVFSFRKLQKFQFWFRCWIFQTILDNPQSTVQNVFRPVVCLSNLPVFWFHYIQADWNWESSALQALKLIFSRVFSSAYVIVTMMDLVVFQSSNRTYSHGVVAALLQTDCMVTDHHFSFL